MLVATCGALPARAAPAEASPQPAPGEAPPDPDDVPFMRAPPGNPQPAVHRFNAPAPQTARRRVALTVLPMYGVFRLDFIGRPTRPARGGGVGAEVDVQLIKWLYLRAMASHTWHPVREALGATESPTVQAAAGHVTGTQFGGSLVYALDLGPFLALIDAGAGGLRIQSPEAVQDGQRGGRCRSGGVCDVGLACTPDNTCEPTVLPEIHLGIGLDVLLGRHFGVGAQLRYHAFFSAPTEFPVYFTAGARVLARF